MKLGKFSDERSKLMVSFDGTNVDAITRNEHDEVVHSE
jgi:hypothetical protein